MKKVLITMMCAVMVIAMMPAVAFAESEEASPLADTQTAESWSGEVNTAWYSDNVAQTSYTIFTAEDLAGLAKLVNEGNDFKGKTITLGSDIDLGGREWTPIGKSGKPFSGNFDGGEKVISNLKITKEMNTTAANCYVGLFGLTNSPATIKALTINNVKLKGGLYIGAVVGQGYTGSEIRNCHVRGNIQIDAYWYAGVIGGNGYMGNVNNCTVIGNSGSYIKGNNGSYIGGIWGFRGEGAQTIENCSVENLQISGVDRTGGISGIAHYGNKIKNCEVKNVKIETTENFGNTGLIAGADLSNANSIAEITDCTVTSTTATAAGEPVTTKLGFADHEGKKKTDGTRATVGTDIEKKDGKIISGTLEQFSTSQIAEGKVPVKGDDGQFTVKPLEVNNAVAVIENTPYASLDKAIEAVQEDDIIIIKQSGEYAPFTINKEGVTVEATENVDAVIEINAANKFAVNAENVTLKNLDFVSVDGTAVISGGSCDKLKLEGCTFVNEKKGDIKNTTALYIHQPNIEITGCTFTNWERGYYTCGDNHSAGKMIIDGNTFTNVRVPFDGYWGKPAGQNTDIQVTNNKIDAGRWKTAYIQLWDYAQYLHWRDGANGNNPSGQTALKATVKDNTATGGELVYYATHCNWFAKSNVYWDQEPLYRNMIILEGIKEGDTVSLTKKDNSPITAFNESTDMRKVGDKYVIYSLSEGDYIVNVTQKTGEGVSVVTPIKLTVMPTVEGENSTQTLNVPETNKNVAKVGEKEYTSLAEAINAAKTDGTVTLLKSVVIDTWNQVWDAKNLTIDGSGETITIGEVESNGNGNYLFYNAENLNVKDLNVVFKTNGNGFDMKSGTLTNVNMTGGPTSNYAVYVGTSESGKVTIDNCSFTNFKAAVYSQPSGANNTSVSDIVIKNSDFNNCPITMVSYAADTVFTGNTVKEGSEISFAGAVDSANEDVSYTVTENIFEDAGKIWFSNAELDNVTFEKNTVIGRTEVNTSGADGKLDVSGNYWGGGKPSGQQITGGQFTGQDVYYEKPTMNPEDLNTYTPPYIPGAPSVQKPVIEPNADVTTSLSSDGTTLSVTAKEGFEIVDVTVNGVSKGAVTTVTGLKTGDKVVIVTKAIEELTAAEKKIAACKETKLIARSQAVKTKSGKKAIKITWKAKEGSLKNLDGVQIFRSTKRADGTYKKVFTSKSGKYINTSVKKGQMYYYKVRGYVRVDGKLYFTKYSTKAWRRV